ncbi:MAG: calcium/sodium antiporter [Pseudomonadota bacterium]|nr:calcium/sodium antiporter [Pseudomonadota bacterium]
MWIEIVAILAGLVLLVVTADRFVAGAAALAQNLGVSTLVIGLTIVGFGTSAPEILVSGMAAFSGNAGLAIGNAIGSNIANIGLILGVTALIVPLAIASKTLQREYPIVVGVTMLSFLLMIDGELGFYDGLILLLLLFVVLFYMWKVASRGADEILAAEIEAEMPDEMPTSKAVLWLILGLTGLLIASKLLVWGAVGVAEALGVSDLIIGLTIVALGTSLPELAASIASALKNEPDLAIGNVLGSNLYNLMAVLSIPGLVAPGPVAAEVLTRDMPVMLALTLAIAGIAYSRKGTHRITRVGGVLLLFAYFSYQGWVITSVLH